MPTYRQEYLETEPEMLFAALRPRTASSAFTNYWRGRYGNVWQDYQGRLAKAMMAGRDPTLTFQQHLQSYPYARQYLGQSPRARGQMGQSMYAPTMRWLT